MRHDSMLGFAVPRISYYCRICWQKNCEFFSALFLQSPYYCALLYSDVHAIPLLSLTNSRNMYVYTIIKKFFKAHNEDEWNILSFKQCTLTYCDNLGIPIASGKHIENILPTGRVYDIVYCQWNWDDWKIQSRVQRSHSSQPKFFQSIYRTCSVKWLLSKGTLSSRKSTLFLP